MTTVDDDDAAAAADDDDYEDDVVDALKQVAAAADGRVRRTRKSCRVLQLSNMSTNRNAMSSTDIKFESVCTNYKFYFIHYVGSGLCWFLSRRNSQQQCDLLQSVLHQASL